MEAGEVFLESCVKEGDFSRYSVRATAPFLILESKGPAIRITTASEDVTFSGDPLECLERLLQKYHSKERESFFGPGAFGYLSYELGYRLQGLPCRPRDDLHLPDLWFAFYDEIQLFDHKDEREFRVGKRLRGKVPLSRFSRGNPTPLVFSPVSLAKEEYEAAFSQAQEHIAAGNVYQVNLSRRFSVPFSGNPWEVYRQVKKAHPTSLCAFFNPGDFSILSFSPELFLRKEGDRVETRPIKGTIRKSGSWEENQQLRKQLFSSPKDFAEHVMIVDLERNDLGRICGTGTIQAARLASLESCGEVFHLVSTVAGKLSWNLGIREILNATFPGGSVTGAPKRKAMEVIGMLEPSVRGIYTGALGWIGFSGDFMLNLPIRTVVIRDGWAHFSLGSGIVADSTAHQEYQELLDKGEAFFKILGGKTNAGYVPSIG